MKIKIPKELKDSLKSSAIDAGLSFFGRLSREDKAKRRKPRRRKK